MTDFQEQLVLVGLDKGLIALIIGAFGFLAKRYLDRMSAQRTYGHRLADERIRAYKEISRIVAEQVMLMGQMWKITERKGETDEARDKIAADFASCYSRLAEHYRSEMPKLHSDLIFASGTIAEHLTAYVDHFGRFMSTPHDLLSGTTPRAPDRTITDISGELLHPMSKEIASFQV